MVASTREANANAKLAGFSVGKVPTERDFAVYRRVAIERVTTREAAQEFSLSQTRVCQIVEQMVQWLATELTAAADGMEEKGRIAVAKHIAASRMDYLYGEAVDAWKTSQKQET